MCGVASVRASCDLAVANRGMTSYVCLDDGKLHFDCRPLEDSPSAATLILTERPPLSRYEQCLRPARIHSVQLRRHVRRRVLLVRLLETDRCCLRLSQPLLDGLRFPRCRTDAAALPLFSLLPRREKDLWRGKEFNARKLGGHANALETPLLPTVSHEGQQVLMVQMHFDFVKVGLESHR